jgi:hypothetical protein
MPYPLVCGFGPITSWQGKGSVENGEGVTFCWMLIAALRGQQLLKDVMSKKLLSDHLCPF